MPFTSSITLRNDLTDDVLCVIPAGHIFENKTVLTGRQNVAVTREYRLIIPAGSTIKVALETACINQTYASPSGPGNVTIFMIDRPIASQQDLWQVMQNPRL
jgi:hypothetical protein